MATTHKQPKVFISYSHDSEEHVARVSALADTLRRDGIDCVTDQYDPDRPPKRSMSWTENHIKEADVVLMVWTQAYFRVAEGNEFGPSGARIVRNYLYHGQAKHTRFVPVVFRAKDRDSYPISFQHLRLYDLSEPDGYQMLLMRILESSNVGRNVTHVVKGLFAKATEPPARIAVVWDPELIDEDEYADLVNALADLVRAEGGAGLKRISVQGFGVPVGEEILI